MKVEQGKLTLKEIKSLNSCLSYLNGVDLDLENAMDLGLIKAEFDQRLTIFQTSLPEKKLAIMEKLGISKDDENVSAYLNNQFNQELESEVLKAMESKHDVTYCTFTKDWFTNLKDKTRDSGSKAFKPDINFFSNLGRFLIK